MKNTVKKVIVVIVVLIMAMMMSAFTWQTEETPVALIEELECEGFQRNENEENIWTYEEYDWDCVDYDCVYIHAWFDTDENVGTVIGVGYANDQVARVETYTVQWNAIEEDFDIIAHYDNEL